MTEQCRCVNENHPGGRCTNQADQHRFCGPCQSEGAVEMDDALRRKELFAAGRSLELHDDGHPDRYRMIVRNGQDVLHDGPVPREEFWTGCAELIARYGTPQPTG